MDAADTIAASEAQECADDLFHSFLLNCSYFSMIILNLLYSILYQQATFLYRLTISSQNLASVLHLYFHFFYYNR